MKPNQRVKFYPFFNLNCEFIFTKIVWKDFLENKLWVDVAEYAYLQKIDSISGYEEGGRFRCQREEISHWCPNISQ